MDDNNQSNQKTLDEGGAVELGVQLDELEKQSCVEDEPQVKSGEGQHNSDTGSDLSGKKLTDETPETSPVAVEAKYARNSFSKTHKDTPAYVAQSSDYHSLESDKKSNSLYYFGLALMVTSLALSVFYYLGGK